MTPPCGRLIANTTKPQQPSQNTDASHLYELQPLFMLIPSNNIINNLSTLPRVRKHVPDVSGHILEGILEALGLVLRFDADGCYVLDLADENDLYPLRISPIPKSLHVLVNRMDLLKEREKEEDKEKKISCMSYISP